LDPSKLAEASNRLLSCLTPKLKQSYHLVVSFSEEKARFQICLDTSLWFNVYLQNQKMYDFTKAINVARQYITNTRLKVSPEDEAPFIVDYKETEKDKAFVLCPYFPTGKCKNSKEMCYLDDHPDIICKVDVVTRDGRQTKCNFYFAIKLIVNELSNGDRKHKHYTNKTLVQHKPFWDDLLSKRQKLDFYSIAINYGLWETGQSQNKYAQECHAHIHLYFTANAWNKVKKRISDPDVLLKFNVRDFSGLNYLLQDCAELEDKKLRPAEHLLVLNAVSNLSLAVEKIDRNLSMLKDNNAALVKRIEGNQRNLISTLNNNNAALVERLDNNNTALIKAIGSLKQK
ncbi:10638_t:CDS:2, partial [Dentiscutata erythropus]